MFICWLTVVALESSDELSGLYLQSHTWNRKRRTKNGIFRQDLGNFSVVGELQKKEGF